MSEVVNVTLPVNLEELVYSFVQEVDQEKILKFIKQVDLMVADWDFTLKLFKHFSNLRKEYMKEKTEERKKKRRVG